MAIMITIQDTTGITYNDAYVFVQRYTDVSEKSAEVEVRIFKDKAAKDAGKDHIKRFSLNLVAADYPTYLANNIIEGQNVTPKGQLYKLLGDIDPTDENTRYKNLPYNFKQDGWRHVTTTQKNRLTPVEGMRVYDETLDEKQIYTSGQWVTQ